MVLEKLLGGGHPRTNVHAKKSDYCIKTSDIIGRNSEANTIMLLREEDDYLDLFVLQL